MLRERLKFLFKDTAIYGLANGISRFVVLLTIPIIVKHIDVESFGVWNMLTILGSVTSAILIFGMDSAVVRYYYDSDTLEHRRNIFSHGVLVLIGTVFCFGIMAVLAPGQFLKSVGVSSSYQHALLIVFVWTPANIFVHYFQNWFKWTFQRIRFLSIALGLATFNIILLLAYTYFGSLTLTSVLTAQAIAAWVFALVGCWWCREYFQAVFDLKMVKNLIAYGLPMMIIMVMSILSPAIDRIFLSHLQDARSLGIYSLIQKISAIMIMVITAFQTAFGPFSFSIWEKKDAQHTFARFQSYYLMLTGLAAIGICSLSRPIILLLGTPEYLGGEHYLPFLILGAIVYGLYSFAAIGIFYAKKVSLNLLACTLGVLTMILVNSWVTPVYQEYGAAFAYLSGNIVMVLVAYGVSVRYYKIPFFHWKDSLILILLAFLLAATIVTYSDNQYLDSTYKLVTLSSVFSLASILLLTNSERKVLRRLVFRNGQ